MSNNDLMEQLAKAVAKHVKEYCSQFATKQEMEAEVENLRTVVRAQAQVIAGLQRGKVNS
jgi:hypothetical protein